MESAANIKAYYCGALAGLRLVEARRPTGRRFGAEADARWAAFRGDLTTADRIDLLIRDADAQWPAAFGARSVFARRAVAEDEPFGVGWEPLDPVDAEEVWRKETAKPATSEVRDALNAVVAAWGLKPVTFNAGPVAPADKLVVAGPAAIIAAIEAFTRGRDLDWADQVVVIATPTAHRQLAALGSAFANVPAPTRLFLAADAPALKGTWRALVSEDADPADARVSRQLGESR